MKARKILTITVIFVVVLSFLVILYFVKPSLFSSIEFLNRPEIPSEYNLSEDNFLVGCIFQGEGYRCFNKQSKEFEESNILDKYSEVEEFNEGFLLIEYNRGKWQESEIDLKQIYTRWYQDISLNEDKFLFEIEDRIHVDMYNLLQLRIIQNRISPLDETDFKNELEKFSKIPYLVITPIRYEDWLYICDKQDFKCGVWEKYQEEPSKILKLTNDDESWDYDDFSKTWSRIRMLAIGLNSLNPEYRKYDEINSEYKKFENSLIANYESMTEEEIIFIGEYLPLGLAKYLDVIYDGWENGYEDDFVFLVDIVCSETNCLESKLNILYDKYER